MKRTLQKSTFTCLLWGAFFFLPVTYLSAQVWTQKGADIDGEADGDKSSTSVSLSSDGTTMAIGAPFNAGGGTQRGHVRVYKLAANGTWTPQGADIDGEADGDKSGTSVSLSADGTTVAIGAPFNDADFVGGGYDRGHVRVYKLVSGTWTQQGADIDGEANGNVSGTTVSLSSDGTTVAIGAPYGSGIRGRTRVYKLVSGTWTQQGNYIDGETSLDQSGESISLSSDGTTVAIGAPRNLANSTNRGHVRVYKLVSGTWTQQGADIDGEASRDYSGNSVSLSSDGTTLAIGAPYNAGGGGSTSYRGHVRVYKLASGAWTKQGADIDGEADNDLSGFSVSLSSDGTTVAIGARNNAGGGSNRGHVRVYKFESNTWTKQGADIDGEADNDNSGNFVSLSSDGTTLAIGAPNNAGGGTQRGHVRVYYLVPPVTPSVSIAASATTICAGTSVTFTATPTNGGTTPQYQWKNGSTNVGTNSATYTDAALANGAVITCVMTSSLANTSPTTATSAGVTMTVNPLTTPSVSIAVTAANQTSCVGASVTFTATPTNGGSTPTYQWQKNNVDISDATSVTYTTSALINTDIITCVLTSSACTTTPTATSTGITMTITTVPTVAAITGNPSVNVGATTALASTTSGGVWSSSNTAIATVSTTGVVTGVAVGSATISYAVTNSCGTTTVTKAMTVLPTYCLTYKPVRTGNYVDVHISLIASGSAFNLGDANLQFKYKSAVLSNPTLQSNALTPTGYYNVVLATVVPPLGFPSDDALITLNSVFNGTAGQGFTINTSETEVAVIRFNIDNTNLSPNIRPYENGSLGMVVFDDSPTLLASTGTCGAYDFALSTNFTYSAPAFCTSATPQTVTLVGTSGGTYTSTAGLSLDATTGQITPSTSTAGTYIVTYNIPSVGGGQAATTVTINASPTPSIVDLNAAYCKNIAAVTLVGNPVGGSFTIDGTTATSLDPSLLTANTHTVVYSYTAANTCSATATQTVTINALPTPSIVDLNAAYCKNIAAVTLVGNPVGGSFSIDGTTATSLDPSLLTANTHTVVYTYTAANTCSATATQSVLINAIPVITVQPTASITVCLGSAINLSVSATGTGLTYQWKKGNSLIAGADAATYEITTAVLDDAATYSVEVNGTCSPNVLSENAVVAINTLPAAITGTPSVNETFTTTLSNAVLGGTWSSSNTAVATVNATTGVVTGVDAGTATITYSLTNACGTNTVTQLFTVLSNKVVVGLKVFLQGPYSTTDGYMKDNLRVAGHVPTVEPYTGMTGFTHKGDGGGEVINSSVLTVTGVNAITDWVFIELRSKTSPTTILSTRSALLQRDGDVVDLDGLSPVSFNDVLADDYYIAVRHRNHLGFRTSTAQPLTNTATNINFTDGSKTTAGISALKIVGGVYLMYCSDGDGNGVINAIDKNRIWLIQNGLSNYLSGDFDMNGVVNAIDINTYWLPNNSRVQQLD